MRLQDIAVWHRGRELECRLAERSERTAYELGCEDAIAIAYGWKKQADRHAAMADAIETALAGGIPSVPSNPP